MTILIVDDEKNIRLTLCRALELEGYSAFSAASAKEALSIATEKTIDAAFIDLRLGDDSGLDVLSAIHSLKKNTACIMMSGHGTLSTAMQAVKLGAVDFLEKPIAIERLLLTLRNALQLSALTHSNNDLKHAIHLKHGIIGRSPATLSLLQQIEKAAPTKARILITGESGVGKELVAETIHALSKRAQGPFIKLNCAALAESVIESELFGHEKGAFTGADKRHIGRFERAHEGTLFLDEIGEMPLGVQAKLLRVLQEGELDRVGSSQSVKVDVRVIAATNRDLKQEISKGRFREDLYYRLNVIHLIVPPLRERREDIPLLAQHLLSRFINNGDVQERPWSDDAMDALKEYDWPGNIRELSHTLERISILSTENNITALDVMEQFSTHSHRDFHTATDVTRDHTEHEVIKKLDDPQCKLYDYLDIAEKHFLLRRLSQHHYHMTHVAQSLGIERSHLYKKLRRLGITTKEHEYDTT